MISNLAYKDLNKKQKIEYIWDYYKIHIFVVLSIIILAFSILNTLVFNRDKEVVLDLTIKARAEDVNLSTLEFKEAELLSLISKNEDDERVLIDFLAVGGINTQNIEVAYQAKFMAKLQSDSLDLMIVHEDYMPILVENNVLADLSFLNKNCFEDSIIKDDKQVAIKITQFNNFSDMFIKNQENYYICTYARARHLDSIKKILGMF